MVVLALPVLSPWSCVIDDQAIKEVGNGVDAHPVLITELLLDVDVQARLTKHHGRGAQPTSPESDRYRNVPLRNGGSPIHWQLVHY